MLWSEIEQDIESIPSKKADISNVMIIEELLSWPYLEIGRVGFISSVFCVSWAPVLCPIGNFTNDSHSQLGCHVSLIRIYMIGHFA